MVYLITLIFLITSNLFAQKPNILIFQTDEHNFRTLGAYRQQLPDSTSHPWGAGAEVATPNIDAIAQNGALCNKFYVNSPVCSPSRATLVSGKYSHNTPVSGNDIPMDDSIKTFAQVLLDNGYATGFAGKWHLNGTGKPEWEPARKFGFEDNRYMFNRGHWKNFEITQNGPQVGCTNTNGAPTYGLCNADTISFSTDFLARRAMDFIDLNKSNPFMYYISWPDPHGPNTVRPPYDTMFTHLTYRIPATASKPDAGLPAWGQKEGTTGAGGLANYFGMVRCIDDNIGMIVDHLKQLQIYNNTILVFTSDHGDLLGEHSRNNKGVPYEGSNKVAFLMQYPGRINGGLVVNDIVTNVDFMPTILSLAGIDNPVAVEGKDASPLFLGQPTQWEDIAFIRGAGSNNWVAAFSSQYKLVYSDNSEPWLFDIVNDENELINFYNDPSKKAVVDAMAKQLKQYGETFNDPKAQIQKISDEISGDILSVKKRKNQIKYSHQRLFIDEPGLHVIELLDINGKIIKKQSGFGKSIYYLPELFLGLNTQGIYLLQIETQNGISRFKFPKAI